MKLVELFHSYQPNSIIAEFGNLVLHWYGLMFAIAIVVGYFITRKIWRRYKWPVHSLDELIVLLVICGLIGARLLDVFVYEWWYFKDHLKEIFYLWQGGLAWHGGLLGAAPALWWWSKKHRLIFWEVVDSFTVALAIGQAIGRWGNYFNQELFGLPTNLPWGIFINLSSRPSGYSSFTYFHPVFLYEFLGLLIIALVIWLLTKRKFPAGRLFAVYLIFIGLLRWSLEFLRIDEQNYYFGLRAGLLIAALTVIAGFLGIVLTIHKKSRSINAG